MRSIALSFSLLLVACGPMAQPEPSPIPEPIDAGTEQPTDAGEPGYSLTFPVETKSTASAFAYTRVDGGVASAETELVFALGSEYPSVITVRADGAYCVQQRCPAELEKAQWTTIDRIVGTAAKASLSNGVLTLDLRDEGDVVLTISGNVSGLDRLTSMPTTLPFTHVLRIAVHRVARFTIDSLHQRWSGCATNVTLPAKSLVWHPTAHPVDAMGRTFEAANAPTPVALTLHSKAKLTRGKNSWEISGEAGHVAITASTTLPTSGLTGFELVEPTDLTAVSASLFLSKAASKGSVSEAIVDGNSYRIFFLGERNAVEVRVTSAQTRFGALCSVMPQHWFAAESSTPQQCRAGASNDTPGSIAVASVIEFGDCALDIRMPNTTFHWATHFSTTR